MTTCIKYNIQSHNRCRHMWAKPGNRDRYQLDSIFIKLRFKNNIMTCKACLMTYIDSDREIQFLN